MMPTRLTSLAIMTVALCGIMTSSRGYGQPLPREDVIEAPAVSEGLGVSNVFQSHMVLQREQPIDIWGWASPGEQVTVTFAGDPQSVEAKQDRSWRVTLPPQPANHAPQSLEIRGQQNTLVLEDVLVGDVWLLGGQSNMEFELAKVENGPLEIISANYPEIRLLTVPYNEGPEPKRGFARLDEWSDWFGRHFRKGHWQACEPETVRELSAIGYVFARRLHKAAQVPIGVIDASRGGTTVEAWTPLSVLRDLDSEPTEAKLAAFDSAVAMWDAEADLASRVQQHAQWIKRQTESGNAIPDDRKQPPADLRPGPIADPNYPGNCYAGMIAPLEGLAIRGVIFHQGYNNAFEGSLGAELYRDVFPAMIRAWRDAFEDPQLPFGILSLCTDGYPQTREDYCEKMFNAGIEIRAVQYQTFLDLHSAGDANIGFASTYDLRRRWYHPQLKIPAGERIARWALATQYGFENQVAWKPPMLTAMERLEGALELTFDTQVGDPEDGAIEGFAIAGEDRRFHPAEVAYAEKGRDGRGRVQDDRKRLILSSPLVPEPVHFRYAWGRNPLANVQASGHKDLPLATQRSDPWPMEAVPRGILEEDVERPLSRADQSKIRAELQRQDRARRVQEAKQVLLDLGG